MCWLRKVELSQWIPQFMVMENIRIALRKRNNFSEEFNSNTWDATSSSDKLKLAQSEN